MCILAKIIAMQSMQFVIKTINVPTVVQSAKASNNDDIRTLRAGSEIDRHGTCIM